MFDLAIYGSGFAAYSLAQPAIRRGLSVLVVEKGAKNITPASLRQSAVSSGWETVRSGGVDFGASDLNKYATVPRFIGVGGTSQIWGGRWRPLDDIDFQRVVRGRRWPFPRSELDASFSAVADEFGFSLEEDAKARSVFDRLSSSELRVIPFCKESTRLPPRWQALEEASKITLLDDIADIDYKILNGSIDTVRLKYNSGKSEEKSARIHVVAAGGIESARIVGHIANRATGQSRKCLGGYMDNARGNAGRLVVTRNTEYLEALLNTGRVRHAIGLPQSELADTGLPNNTITFSRKPSRKFSWRHLYGRRIVDLELHIDQFPEEQNRVMVGAPGKVFWRISGETRHDSNRFLDRIIPRLESVFGKVERQEWVEFRGASHPAGCTPLSANPDEFQVHPDGRLAAVSNGYCVSSSTFPIAGSASPTMTIAALGHRLATTITNGHAG